MSLPIPPQPPMARRSMTPEPWAPSLLRRALRALFGARRSRLSALARREPWRWRRVLLLRVHRGGRMARHRHDGRRSCRNTAVRGSSRRSSCLFGVLFAWISAGFWTGVMGAWVLLRGGDKHAVTNVLKSSYDDGKPIDPHARTAIVMPICNEHVPTVFGGLRATYESLRATGLADRFDFFVLSDTTQPDLRAAEQAAFSALRARTRYRRRACRARACTTAGASIAPSARPATSATSAAAGAATTATWWCSTPTA